MAFRRDPPGNNESRTGIPMPASAMKPPSQNLFRGSMMRSSIAPQPQAGPSNAPRQSIFGLPSIQRVPQSAARASHAGNRSEYGRTPAKVSGGSANRRLTQQHVIRPARVGLPHFNPPTKEARPVREKPYQQIEQREILEYLLSINFNAQMPQLSMKTLQSPTTKEFQEIFKCLVSELDPDWVFPKNKKFEEEFIPILRDLRYPHADQISKTALVAVNSPHSWQNILAVLHWMVECIKSKSAWLFENVCDDPNLEDIDDLDLQSGRPEIPHILNFNHLVQTYNKYWEAGGEQDFAEEDDDLVQRYRRKNEGITQERDEIEEELKILSARLAEYKSTPGPLEAAETRLRKATHRLEGATKTVKQVEEKRPKALATQAGLRAALLEQEERLKELATERKRIHAAIAQQNLTPEEVARMNSEQDALSKTIQALRARLYEAQAKSHDLEVALTHRTQEIDEDLATYHALLQKAGLDPAPPEPVSDVEFTIDLIVAKSDPKKMTDADVRGVIKPAILTFKTHKLAEKEQANDAIIEDEKQLDQLVSWSEKLKENIAAIREELQLTLEQADVFRERNAEETEITKAESSRLERDAREIENGLRQGMLALRTHLDALLIEYDDVVHKVKKIQDEVNEKIISSSGHLAQTKADVTSSLVRIRDEVEALK